MAKKTKTQTDSQPPYNQEFRETAIKLALAGDKAISDVAAELGIPAKRLYTWVSAWKKRNSRNTSGSKLPIRKGADDELLKLKKRVKDLEQENEILKKASAYFARTLL